MFDYGSDSAPSKHTKYKPRKAQTFLFSENGDIFFKTIDFDPDRF